MLQAPNFNSLSGVSLAAAFMSLSYSTIAFAGSLNVGKQPGELFFLVLPENTFLPDNTFPFVHSFVIQEHMHLCCCAAALFPDAVRCVYYYVEA